METVILGLGSNQGDSKAILTAAVAGLHTVLNTMKLSSIYITAPQEYTDQADFYNMVVAGGYEGNPSDLLRQIQTIEREHGRNRALEVPKGPRTLDIDIIFFGSRSIKMQVPLLTIPHPAVLQRAFVLIPLLELYPNYADPRTGVPLSAVLADLPAQGVCKAYSIE